MSESVISLGQALISGIWSLFDIPVPGFGFTFRELWLGVAICSLSLVIFKMFFGLGRRSSGSSPRTSSTNRPKISKRRERDEY